MKKNILIFLSFFFFSSVSADYTQVFSDPQFSDIKNSTYRLNYDAQDNDKLLENYSWPLHYCGAMSWSLVSYKRWSPNLSTTSRTFSLHPSLNKWFYASTTNTYIYEVTCSFSWTLDVAQNPSQSISITLTWATSWWSSQETVFTTQELYEIYFFIGGVGVVIMIVVFFLRLIYFPASALWVSSYLPRNSFFLWKK